MKPTVTVTDIFPEVALDKLRSRVEVLYNDSGSPLSPLELSEYAKKSQALICYLTDKIDASVIDVGGEHLKIIANFGAGYNNIDVAHAMKRNILVSNTPGVLHETTADLTWAMMLGIARRLVESDRFTRRHLFQGWKADLFLGGDVYGKTLGVIGCGEIGRAVARRALGFDMTVLYHQRHRLPENEEKRLNARFVSLQELLEASDFVTLHVPLTEETHHMIGADELSMMKPTAYLIHAARGKVVDDQALLEALTQKVIAGAALDVYENEPALTDGLDELGNIILLPHIGSASVETRETMALLVVDNVFDALDGNKPRSLVPGWVNNGNA
ncbi:MAG: D-glycerate dehydrogenase [Nitrospinaceae bacterium]|nr:D-glycerate dehydrogenase [Nitrospinaceae bacterium]NIR53521.1 D-glycerate dehydrogenase [Nitrospinaceae bacterium]NIS83920.1 D-glycerate dehydrogenase [Nitrospinaceae bacterium]NIT80728.1 D-glycerate dehydrogenase [Nitrospinaceae bacterium]NIU43037.1 D-glycerate dehydrogenase [Nitrospinaceae bacterium]